MFDTMTKVFVCSFVHNIVNYHLYLLHKNIISMLRQEYLANICTFILIIYPIANTLTIVY